MNNFNKKHDGKNILHVNSNYIERKLNELSENLIFQIIPISTRFVKKQ